MSSTNYEITSLPVAEVPPAFYYVTEGRFATATYDTTSSFAHLATKGIYVCKGITFYDPETSTGLLAHMSHVSHLDLAIEALVRAYKPSLEETEVHIVQAITTAGRLERTWPTSERIADEIQKYKPKSTFIDPNAGAKYIRGISLDLITGTVAEIDPSDSAEGKTTIGKRPIADETFNRLIPTL